MKDDVLQDIPLGFGMALAQNMRALTAFSALSVEEKKRIIAGTHNVRSKEEMQAYVDRLAL